MIYLLSDDLLDASKTITSARAVGVRAVQVKSLQALIVRVEMEVPTCCIIDLQSPGLSIPAVRELLEGEGKVRLIAYGSHVDAPRLQEAKDGGCDEVFARSRYFKVMPEKIAEWAKSK